MMRGRACARDLRLYLRGGDRQVEVKHPSTGQAIALQSVPHAQHLYRDSKIFGDRFDRIAASHFVMRGGAGVGAGVALLACGYRNDQACVRRE